MKIRKSTIAWIVIGVYLVLLGLLFLAESSYPAESGGISGESAGSTLANAIWYSIVTMTTVGYGDIIPRSPIGHVIGICFMLLSLGILTLLVSWLISSFKSSVLPSLVLLKNRDKPWHVFFMDSKPNSEIIRNWKQAYPDDFIIQAGTGTAWEEADISVAFTPSRLLKSARSHVTFYCFGESDADNFISAEDIAGLGAAVYYQSDILLDNIKGMDCFNPAISCARQFWTKHPLQAEEKKILLIGGGQHLSALLEQALLVNIYDTDQRLEYNVCGNSEQFRTDHYGLETQGDLVNFIDGFPDAKALSEADRIILCMETDEENAELYNRLIKYHPFRGTLYIRLHRQLQNLPQAVIFGSDRDLYTPDLIIHHTMDRTAKLINELYGKQNPEYATPWDALDDYSRESNIAAADHLLTKLQLLLNDRGITEITPENCRRAAEEYQRQKDLRPDFFRKLEHIRWCRFLFLRNWRYGDIPKKDKQARIHPLLCPYEDLPEEEQAKDENAWIAIGEIFTSGL